MNTGLKSAIKLPIILFYILFFFLLLPYIFSIENLNVLNKAVRVFIGIIGIALMIVILKLFYQLVKSYMNWKRKLFFASPRLLLILSMIIGEISVITTGIISLGIHVLLIFMRIELSKKESLEK